MQVGPDLERRLQSARATNDFAAIDELLAPVVDAAAGGDDRALGELLRVIDRLGMAEAPVRKYLLDERDVEDAVQTTLLAVSRAIGGFERRSRFTTWLYRIAEREALQVLRRNKRVTAPEGDELGELAEEVRRMSSVVAGAETLRAALEALPENLKAAVVMRDVDGLDYAEIADRLDVPLGTVKTWIRKGRIAVSEAVVAAARAGQPMH